MQAEHKRFTSAAESALTLSRAVCNLATRSLLFPVVFTLRATESVKKPSCANCEDFERREKHEKNDSSQT